MEFQLHVLRQHYPLLVDGALLTLFILAIALVVGIGGGALFCTARLSGRPRLDRFARAYILFFRTTPEMVLIFWGYACVPLIFHIKVSGVWAGSIILGLVAAAYLAEIFRAGIQAVPRGQVEATVALGLPALPRWRLVILPQALKLMVPPLVNYFTELMKATTLLSLIGVGELALQAYTIGGLTYRYIEPLSAIALVYFAVIFPISLLSRRLERRADAH